MKPMQEDEKQAEAEMTDSIMEDMPEEFLEEFPDSGIRTPEVKKEGQYEGLSMWERIDKNSDTTLATTLKGPAWNTVRYRSTTDTDDGTIIEDKVDVRVPGFEINKKFDKPRNIHTQLFHTTVGTAHRNVLKSAIDLAEEIDKVDKTDSGWVPRPKPKAKPTTVDGPGGGHDIRWKQSKRPGEELWQMEGPKFAIEEDIRAKVELRVGMSVEEWMKALRIITPPPIRIRRVNYEKGNSTGDNFVLYFPSEVTDPVDGKKKRSMWFNIANLGEEVARAACWNAYALRVLYSSRPECRARPTWIRRIK